jgi:hypothetical protein
MGWDGIIAIIVALLGLACYLFCRYCTPEARARRHEERLLLEVLGDYEAYLISEREKNK